MTPQTPGQAVDPTTVLTEYAAWMDSWNASATTIRSRRSFAAARLKEWGLSGFTGDNIQTFMNRPTSTGKPKSKWTKATYHGHLTDLCAWLVATDRLAENPMSQVRSPIRPHSLPRPLSEAEVARVLEAATGRTRDWILLALLAGLRASEVAAVRGEDVGVDGIYVFGKGGTKVVLPCHADLWDMAQRYPKTGYWFPGHENGHIGSQQVSLIVGRLFDSLGIDGAIHRCRHVFGTRLLRRGAHIRTVQKLMRHASLDTTAAYTAVDEDELRAAVNLLGPMA